MNVRETLFELLDDQTTRYPEYRAVRALDNHLVRLDGVDEDGLQGLYLRLLVRLRVPGRGLQLTGVCIPCSQIRFMRIPGHCWLVVGVDGTYQQSTEPCFTRYYAP